MKKRQLVYDPEFNPISFVLLFEKGISGESWSVRDYSKTVPILRYGGEFRTSLGELRARAMRRGLIFDAPTVSTTNLDYWHKCITGYNNRYLQRTPELPPSSQPTTKADDRIPACYPVLALDKLKLHAKWQKRQDRDRMLSSSNSEDWVTWNAFQLLTTSPELGWWPHLFLLAAESNSNLIVPNEWLEIPEVKFWQTIASPKAYEAASRERMRCSGNREWMLRSENPSPVEGKSEIDIIFQNSALSVFAEAKLGSDISPRTTYDPSRNQIVRNIDCLLDSSSGRSPLFLMLVRDVAEGRAYTQLVSSYRRDPRVLARDLPHQDPETVEFVARNLSVVSWSDLLSDCLCDCSQDDEETSAVKRELKRRVRGESK